MVLNAELFRLKQLSDAAKSGYCKLSSFLTVQLSIPVLEHIYVCSFKGYFTTNTVSPIIKDYQLLGFIE